MALSAVVIAAELPAIPKDLQLDVPAVADDQNALLLLTASLPELSPARLDRWNAAWKGVREGEVCEDAEMLAEAEKIHKKADELLRLPARIPPDFDPLKWSGGILRLMRTEDLLARQACLQGDRTKMDLHVDALLSWNRKLRSASPNALAMSVARGLWTMAFNVLWVDWEKHPAQEERLKEIEARFLKSRPSREEIADVVKNEFLCVRNEGRLPDMLERYFPDKLSFLNPPFNQISLKELLKLPYDEAASFSASSEKALKNLEDVRSSQPVSEWRMVTRKVPERTMEDYKALPNGLYVLISEQAGRGPDITAYSSPLVLNAQMETCLLWLKAEQSGKRFDETNPTISKDPMNGKPLRVEVDSRFILSVGSNLKPDEPTPLTSEAGFSTLGEPLLRVPKWR